MNISKSYSVAGFVFTVEADPALLDRLIGLKPFVLPADYRNDARERCGAGVVPSDPCVFLHGTGDTPGRVGIHSGHLPEEMLFKLTQVAELPEPEGEVMFKTDDGPGFPEIAIWQRPDGYLFKVCPLPGKPVAGELLTSADFSSASLHVTGVDDRFALDNALMLMFAFSTANRGILEMHSSVVKHGGRGYMFLGNSGTGKSTHSSLWLKHIPDCELLNDDNPILRLMPDGSARVYGSPWSGKTPCYKSDSVPVGGIVRLHQAPHNVIKRLSPLESYASLMSSASSFRPFPGLAEGWHRTLEGLVGVVPCYDLECLPDRNAALTCHKAVAVFHNPQ